MAGELLSAVRRGRFVDIVSHSKGLYSAMGLRNGEELLLVNSVQVRRGRRIGVDFVFALA